MEFYKKNPEIKDEVIWINGEMVDNNTVVSGDNYKMFADPLTFPGKPPKLVKVELKDLSSDEVFCATEIAKKELNKPPRHLPLTTTDQFAFSGGGSLIQKEEPKFENDIVETIVDKEINLTGNKKAFVEKYTASEFADLFPGIKESNAIAVMEKFKTLEALSMASNSELKLLGIPANYFRRVREKARELIGG